MSHHRRLRGPLLAAALLAVLLAPAAAAIEPGERGVALTAVTGNRIEEIPLTYVGVVKDFAGPGYDIHLVQLEGPIADRVGVAAGMSGSPVYFEGELLGALAYRFGALPSEPIAGVTPIENMLEATRSAAAPSTAETGASPIMTPILVGGLVPSVRGWLAEELAESRFVLTGGGSSEDTSPAPLRPGSPVGVELVRGDMRIAATGTVTLIDEDRVYAFGHPFLGAGRIEMPMVAAEVVHTLADMAGSSKLSNVGGQLGAFVEDRLTAIVGRTGADARMIPVRLDLRGAHGEQRLEFEIARDPRLTPLLAGAVVANGLLANTSHESVATILAEARIQLEGQPALEIDLAFAGEGAPDPSLVLAGTLQQVLAALWRNPFTEVQIERLEFDVHVVPEMRRYQLQSIHFDRRTLRPGQVLEVDCVLQRHRGESETRRLRLQLPDRLPRDAKLNLAVGTPAEVDRLMGQTLSRRLQSAQDLRAVVQVLDDWEPANRLTAVVYRDSPGVVRGGAMYDGLPPTAERLLSTGLAGTRSTRVRVSPLAHASEALDGPLAGVRSSHLDLNHDLPNGNGAEETAQ